MKLSYVALALLGGLVCFGVGLHILRSYSLKPTLSISTPENIVKIGEEIPINAELHNRSPLPFASMSGPQGFYIHEILITRNSGDRVEQDWPGTITHNITPSPRSVESGDTGTDSFTLKERYFYLDKPDKYIIRAYIDEKLPFWQKIFFVEPEHIISNELNVDVIE